MNDGSDQAEVVHSLSCAVVVVVIHQDLEAEVHHAVRVMDKEDDVEC